MVRKHLGRQTLAAGLSLLLVAGCGATTKSAPSGSGSSTAAGAPGAPAAGPEGRPDITSLCGTKSLQVAMVDGFSGNAWRKIVRAEYEDEAHKCPNIDKVLYLDAGGDQQRYISSIDGLVAQGVDVIIGTNDFGSATLAALRRAHQRGVAVVPYNADPGGVVGKDYTDFVSVDYTSLVKAWAQWINRALKGSGNLLYVGGPAGNPQDRKWLAALEKELAPYPGLKLLRDTFLETKYDPASVQRAIAGALSKYGRIDGYVSSYGAAMTGALRAYANAGKPVPPIATVANSNEFGCLWIQSKAGFPVLSMDTTPYLPRIALRKGIAAATGARDNEPSAYQVQPFMDTLDGKKPRCDKELPPDADLSSTLSTDQLKTLFTG